MNNMHRAIMAVTTLSVTSSIFAQDIKEQQPEIPAPPYVASIPEFFQWTMTVHEKKDKAERDIRPNSSPSSSPTPPPLPAVKEIVCTKTKDTKRDVITFNTGRKVEVWYYQKYVIVRSPNGEFSVDPAHGEDAGVFVPRTSTPGFYGLDWIKAENFKEKMKLEGNREVLVFRDTRQVASGRSARLFGSSKPSEVSVQATIDSNSRFPLVLQEGKDTYEFTYQSPPNSMLPLPPDFQAEVARLKKTNDMIRALDAAANRP